MTERHYTLREIDEMRALVGRIMDAPAWANMRRYGVGVQGYRLLTLTPA